MTNQQRLFVIVGSIFAGLSLALTACSAPAQAPLSVPAGAKPGDVQVQPCIFKIEASEYKADCGMLVVPENRARADSRLIALPLTRIHASGSALAEPIIFLDGGPGEDLNLRYKPPADLLARHDFILIGYRGTNGSTILNCPEVDQAMLGVGGDLLSAPSRANLSAARAGCARRLQAAGVDLAGYTILDVAADLEAARTGLGYARVDLLTRGYGTLVAQLYANQHSEQIFRSVMIDPITPGRNMVFEPQTIDAQIEYYARLCAQDAACSTRTTDLAATMRTVTHNLPDHWLFFPIDTGKLRVATFLLLKRTGNAAMVFDAYLAAEHGDPSGLLPLQLLYDLEVPITWTVWGDFYAKSGIDFDPSRNYAAEMDPSGSILGSPLSFLLWGSPLNWPVAPIPSEFRQGHPSNVETLLVTGSIDPRAPAEFAVKELLPALSNGKLVNVAEAGHELLEIQPEAMKRLLTSFYDTGTADESLYAYAAVNFQASPSTPALAKIVLGIAALLIVAIIAATWLIIRRVKQRKPRRQL